MSVKEDDIKLRSSGNLLNKISDYCQRFPTTSENFQISSRTSKETRNFRTSGKGHDVVRAFCGALQTLTTLTWRRILHASLTGKIRDVIENVVVHQSLRINETFNRRSYDVESVYQYSLVNSTHTS